MFDGDFGGGEAAGIEDRAAIYASHPAWEKSVVHLRQVGVPDQLRRELLDHLFSPTVVTQVLAAYRFLGLTDEEHRPTPDLHELVAAHGTPDWPGVLRRVLERAYPRIFALDLSRATREQLDEAFKVFPGSSDAVRRKAVGFFLSAAREAGVALSAELAEPRRRALSDFAVALSDALSDPAHVPSHGAHVLPPNSLLAAASPPSLLAAPRNALLPSVTDARAASYGAAYAALSAVWEPDQMPEDVDAAVVTILRYLRRKEAEASKA